MTHRERFERHTQETWNEGNLDALDKFLADDYVEHDPSVEDEFQGRETYRKNVRNFRSAFPDLTVTNEDVLVDGDKLVARQTFGGTHRGEFMGIEPTGKEVESTSIVICRFENDRIAETWVTTDVFGLLEQLGVEVP